MKRFGLTAASIAAVLGLTGLFTACSSRSDSGDSPARSAAAPRAYSSLANGRSIFQTGRDVDGIQIEAQTPPLGLSCEACHSADGSGGRHFGDGAVSADLRHRAIVVEQQHPYTLALLERAISTGFDNEGKPLDGVMPHWHLSKRDLHDVAEYVLRGLH